MRFVNAPCGNGSGRQRFTLHGSRQPAQVTHYYVVHAQRVERAIRKLVCVRTSLRAKEGTTRQLGAGDVLGNRFGSGEVQADRMVTSANGVRNEHAPFRRPSPEAPWLPGRTA